MNAIATGAAAGFVFGIIIGAVIGTIVAVIGATKNKGGLAIGGFSACTAAGAVLGFIGAVPCAVAFIIAMNKNSSGPT